MRSSSRRSTRDYYDFQVNRPQVRPGPRNGVRQLTWPTTRCTGAAEEHRPRRPADPRDRAEHALAGVLRSCWRSVDGPSADRRRARRIAGPTPHRPGHPGPAHFVRPELSRPGASSPSTYEGPTGITGVFGDLCSTLGVPSVSVWSAIPHYIAGTPCPKASLALLGKIEALLDLAMPEGELPELARAWQRGADELSEEDPRSPSTSSPRGATRHSRPPPRPPAKRLAAEFERYLRRRNRTTPPTDVTTAGCGAFYLRVYSRAVDSGQAGSGDMRNERGGSSIPALAVLVLLGIVAAGWHLGR